MKFETALKSAFMVWAYAGWFCCVLAGKWSWGAYVIIFPILTWPLFLKSMSPTSWASFKLFLMACFGFSFDLIAWRLNWITFTDSSFPFWLAALWLHFVPTLFLLMLAFGSRLWIAVIFGGVMGPISYKSGEAFEVLAFSDPLTPFIYALFWAAFTPLAIYSLRKKESSANANS